MFNLVIHKTGIKILNACNIVINFCIIQNRLHTWLLIISTNIIIQEDHCFTVTPKFGNDMQQKDHIKIQFVIVLTNHVTGKNMSHLDSADLDQGGSQRALQF